MNAIVFERVGHYYPSIPSINIHILSEKDLVDCVYPNPDTNCYEPCYERHYFIDGEDYETNEDAQIRFARGRSFVRLSEGNIKHYISLFHESLMSYKTQLKKLEKNNSVFECFLDDPEYVREEIEQFTKFIGILEEIKGELAQW